jgi:hypothetical protein
MAADVASTLDAALEPLIRQLAALPPAKRLAVVRAAEDQAQSAGRIGQTPDGFPVVDAPGWQPGRLDRAEIYAEDE